ncbi:MAG: HAD-IIIA family hydrolase [Epsilonproteobacteria bacterium]|nr:HAD-IIIA family hydrolase [Campylobacterota bacterium]
MKLAIIAGGKGTRLGLKDIPKPMVEIAGKPLLEHQILLAKRYGMDEIYILSGHLSHVIRDYFGDGSKWGLKITHIVEREPLGTAGAIKQLEGMIDERFMVFYGDTMMDIDLENFIRHDREDSLGTLMVHPNDHPYDSDLVDIDKENRIVKFYSKPHPENVYLPNLVNAALYIFSPEIFQYIEPGKMQDFGKDIFPRLDNLYAYKTTEYLKDMGTPERLEKVERDYLSGKISRLNRSNKQKAIFLDRDGVINKEVDNLCTLDEFELLPGVSEALKMINDSEYIAIVVTNQPVIAKGFITEEELKQIHNKMATLLGHDRVFVDDLYYCPHHPEKGFEGEIPELKIDCDCRKPKSGMLTRAAEDYNIDLSRSWIIGDRYADIQAGKNVGCRGILVETGHAGSDREKFDVEVDYVEKDLLSAVKNILKV